MTRRNPLFTIGHSNRSVAELIALLEAADVGLLADVRAFPRGARGDSHTRPRQAGPLTLVYSAHDEAHNQAVVLRETLLH